jgi:hypothetical protein
MSTSFGAAEQAFCQAFSIAQSSGSDAALALGVWGAVNTLINTIGLDQETAVSAFLSAWNAVVVPHNFPRIPDLVEPQIKAYLREMIVRGIRGMYTGS